jgi:DNA-binding NarL/FixJ family response regulator
MPCILVADGSFIGTLDLAEFAGGAESGRSIKILIVMDDDNPDVCKKMLRMGCSGTILRTASAAVFRRSLRAVADGELWASRRTLGTLVRELLVDDSPRRLTTREKEILTLIAKGYKNREIAETLFISRETVHWHVRSIYTKLGVRDRQQAIAHALVTGTVRPTKPPSNAESVEPSDESASAQGA